MDVEIQLEGQDVNDQTVLALQDWIRREDIAGLQVKRKGIAPEPGQMGADAGTVLSVVLGSAAAVQLVKSIHVWLQTKRRVIKIKLRAGSTTIEIDADNVVDERSLIESVAKLAQGLRS